MKTMTFKEFKETLKGTKYEHFKLEDILNSLSLLCDYQAKEDKQNGLLVLSEYNEKDANTIYEKLNAKGYYK